MALDAKTVEVVSSCSRRCSRRIGDGWLLDSRLREVLVGRAKPKSYLLRGLAPGDLGWVVRRHGSVYAEELGYDGQFEALVARIVADYAERRDPEREGAWFAEIDGEPVGSVFCVKKSATVAQLRCLIVERRARGLGIGRRLVDECVGFAQRSGYRRMVLWTHGSLHSARRIYEGAGFTLEREEANHSFGRDVVDQHWSRAL